jgi:hypothetical protein
MKVDAVNVYSRPAAPKGHTSALEELRYPKLNQ